MAIALRRMHGSRHALLGTRPVNPASQRGLACAIAELIAPSPDGGGQADPLALMEQWRLEDEARRNAQRVLRFR